MSTRKYVVIAGVSRATAYRELTDLVDAGSLLRTGQGRGLGTRWPSPEFACADGLVDAAVLVLVEMQVRMGHPPYPFDELPQLRLLREVL